MAYSGLIGKLGNNIFNGSGAGTSGAAMYAGIGAGAGALLGGYASDDGVIPGAFRGALFGGAVGAGVNLIPKGVSSAFKTSGMKSITSDMIDDISKTAPQAFKQSYDNAQRHKELIKGFVPGARQAWDQGGNAKTFSKNVIKNLAKDMKDIDVNTLKDLDAFGQQFIKDQIGFEKTSAFKTINDVFKGNVDIFNNMQSTSDKVALGSSFVAKTGFDSVYHHLVKPTGSLINKVKNKDFKGITGGEYAATAFNAFGIYEAGSMVNDVADGNYGSALVTGLMLTNGKIAFSQGANLIRTNKILKENNMTWGGVGSAVGGGVFVQRFSQGFQKWGPEDFQEAEKLFARN